MDQRRGLRAGLRRLAHAFDHRQLAACTAQRNAFGHDQRLLGAPAAWRKEDDALFLAGRFERLGDRFGIGLLIVAFGPERRARRNAAAASSRFRQHGKPATHRASRTVRHCRCGPATW